MSNTIKRLSAFEEAQRRQSMTKTIWRRNRMAYWYPRARKNIREASKEVANRWLATWLKLFGCGEYYQFLQEAYQERFGSTS